MTKSDGQANALIIQSRDIALFRDLIECRIMTAQHISAIHFGDAAEYTKKRLQQLKAAGYIAERRGRVSEPAILSLGEKGFVHLKHEGILAEYPHFSLPALMRRGKVSNITLAHELEVMDVKAVFHRAIRDTATVTIAEFSTWPFLNQFTACRNGGEEVLVKPDGFIRLQEKDADGGVSEHTFFLEVDRSTETLDALTARAGCYLNYYQSGGFAERNGAPRSAYKDFPFRVLIVFKTAERRNNMAERLLHSVPPILTQVYLSTMTETTVDPLGAVWVRSLDYRDGLAGTAFDATQPRPVRGYQRETAREMFIERTVKKSRLLEDG